MAQCNSQRIPGWVAIISLALVLTACGGGVSFRQVRVFGPQITSQPVGPIISANGTATLTVAASGDGSLSYQWYQGPSGNTSNAISGATSSSYTTPSLSATTGYWVKVSDSNGSNDSNTAVVLIAGPRQVQALLYSTVNDSGIVSIAVPGNFMGNVLQNISGVSVSMPWSMIESSDSTGTRSGGYSFVSFDNALRPFLNSGRAVNLIVWPATEGGNNDPNTGGATPAYVLSSAYAATLGAAPLDMAVCNSYTGDSANPDFASAQAGAGGSWNATTSADQSGLPVSYETPFMTAYQAFIKQVIEHYNTPGNPTIGYIRFGFSQGGENSPLCNQYWPGYSKTTYLNYVQTMTNYVKQQNPSMTILGDLHAVGVPGQVDYGYADTEALDSVNESFGFGTNGLQKSDVSALQNQLPCDSDWCNMFALYASKKFGGNPITLSLQTLQWTDPTDSDSTNATGSLTVLEPLAKANAANNLELYQADVGLAFDSGNYCSYLHNGCPAISAGTYSNAYILAIQDFMSAAQ